MCLKDELGGREGERGRGPYWIGRGVECGVGPGNSWCPRRRPRLRVRPSVRPLCGGERGISRGGCGGVGGGGVSQVGSPFCVCGLPSSFATPRCTYHVSVHRERRSANS